MESLWKFLYLCLLFRLTPAALSKHFMGPLYIFAGVFDK